MNFITEIYKFSQFFFSIEFFCFLFSTIISFDIGKTLAAITDIRCVSANTLKTLSRLLRNPLRYGRYTLVSLIHKTLVQDTVSNTSSYQYLSLICYRILRYLIRYRSHSIIKKFANILSIFSILLILLVQYGRCIP